MRHLFIFFVFAVFFAACKNNTQNQTLEKAFLKSLQKNNVELLKDYLPDITFYKSLGDKMPKRTDEQIKEFLAESNDRVKVAWQNTLFNAVSKKMDLDKVIIKEVFYYDPFKKDEQSEAMVINYEYNGRTWDDLQFIVNRYRGKTYLLGIPNPTRAFSMADPTLRATNEAKTWIEMGKPEFKKSLEDQVKKIISSVNGNDLVSFAGNLVYRGNDASRQWRSTLNINDSLEKLQAADFMTRASHYLKDCGNYRTGEILSERESEGTWIVMPVKCDNNKIIQLAFLRVDGRLLLGDIQAEGN